MCLVAPYGALAFAVTFASALLERLVLPGTPIETLDLLMPSDSCRGTGNASRGVVTEPTDGPDRSGLSLVSTGSKT